MLLLGFIEKIIYSYPIIITLTLKVWEIILLGYFPDSSIQNSSCWDDAFVMCRYINKQNETPPKSGSSSAMCDYIIFNVSIQ